MGFLVGVSAALDDIQANRREIAREERAAKRRREERAEQRAFQREETLMRLFAQREAELRSQPKFEKDIRFLQSRLMGNDGKLVVGGSDIMTAVKNDPSSAPVLRSMITKHESSNNINLTAEGIVNFSTLHFTEAPEQIDSYQSMQEILSSVDYSDPMSVMEAYAAAQTPRTTKGTTVFGFQQPVTGFGEDQRQVLSAFTDFGRGYLLDKRESLRGTGRENEEEFERLEEAIDTSTQTRLSAEALNNYGVEMLGEYAKGINKNDPAFSYLGSIPQFRGIYQGYLAGIPEEIIIDGQVIPNVKKSYDTFLKEYYEDPDGMAKSFNDIYGPYGSLFADIFKGN